MISTFYLLIGCGQTELNDSSSHKIVIVEDKYSNGNIKVMGAIVDEKPLGLWVHYREEGLIEEKKIYLPNSNSYLAINYWETGDTASIGYVFNNQRIGFWKEFYSNNKIASKGNYKNGAKNGKWEYFTDDGRLREIIEFLPNGKKKQIIKDTIDPPTP